MEKFVLTSEELRDLCWYAQIGAKEYTKLFSQLNDKTLCEETNRIHALAAEIRKFDYRQLDEYYKIEGLKV